ncbi:hypothetical protein WJX84_004002 [Apatococcus fuscideae]|uniref:Uncharacterized protein n=1 Tax=Apatococcus fuscideae TaxID=2026836 RepID=A0AAW1T206_9CHLO
MQAGNASGDPVAARALLQPAMLPSCCPFRVVVSCEHSSVEIKLALPFSACGSQSKYRSPVSASSRMLGMRSCQPPRFSKQFVIVVVSGVVSVSGAYFLKAYSLPGKVDRLKEDADNSFEAVHRSLEKVESKFDKLSAETAEYRRELAVIRGGFRILLDKIPPPKK